MGFAVTIRDSTVGQLLRLAGGKKHHWLQYDDERHPQKWIDWYSEEGMQSRSSQEQTNSETDTSSDRESQKLGEKENGKDTHLVEFRDDDDENPQTWTTSKKSFITLLICLLTFGIYIGSPIYSAGEAGFAADAHVSIEVATIGLTAFVLGYGIGPMLWSPLSEIPAIGRNPIYMATLLVFVILQVPTALNTSIGAMIPLRFFAGFFGSPVLATGGASFADMFSAKKRAHPMTVWGLIAVCGPVLGPLVAGFSVAAESWRWAIWELLWLSGFCLAVLIFTLPETSSATILLRRARRLRALTGNDELKSQSEIDQAQLSAGKLARQQLLMPFVLGFTEPIVFFINAYTALLYGVLYTWFEAFPIVFGGIYGWSSGVEGLSFLGIFVGVVVAAICFEIYLYFYLEKKFDEAENGMIRPELRLPPGFFGAIGLPISLFWFGWTSRPEILWLSPLFATGLFGASTFLLFLPILNYLPDAYQSHAASILAGNDFFRSAFGAGFPLFARYMFNQLGVDWASSLLGFLALALAPIPFVFYLKGAEIRKRSKLAG